MPTAGASWIQECGAVAASLSLSSLFPHSPQDHQECHHLPVSPGTESPASHNTNLATIMEDENNVGSSIGNKENSGYSDENNAEEYDRAISIAALTARKEEAKTRTMSAAALGTRKTR